MTEWQPIETAPKDGTKILAWFADGGDYSIINWMSWSKFGGWSQELPGLGSDGYYDSETFTHWMPLPEPPKQEPK